MAGNTATSSLKPWQGDSWGADTLISLFSGLPSPTPVYYGLNPPRNQRTEKPVDTVLGHGSSKWVWKSKWEIASKYFHIKFPPAA